MSDDLLEKGLKVCLVLGLIGMFCTVASCTLHIVNKPEPINITAQSNFMEKVVVSLEPGEKLVDVDWKQDNNFGYVFILTRPMKPEEQPEVYQYKCISSKLMTLYEIKEVAP